MVKALNRIAKLPLWFLVLVVLGFALAMGLILLGAKGNEIAGPLSLLVAIVALGVAIYLRPTTEGDDVTEPAETATRFRFRRGIVLAGLVVLLGGALGTFYTAVIYKVPLQVTDQVETFRTPADPELAWTAVVRGQSDGRSRLTAQLHLINEDKTGNCVAPTQLQVAPVQNGSVGRPLDGVFRDGDEVSVEVGDVARPGLAVSPVSVTPGCRLALRLDDVVLDNAFPW